MVSSLVYYILSFVYAVRDTYRRLIIVDTLRNFRTIFFDAVNIHRYYHNLGGKTELHYSVVRANAGFADIENVFSKLVKPSKRHHAASKTTDLILKIGCHTESATRKLDHK